jgi:hypothetical protein
VKAIAVRSSSFISHCLGPFTWLAADVTLELGSLPGRTDTHGKGTITVLLNALLPMEASKSAVTCARRDIESRGIVNFGDTDDAKRYDYLGALGTVVAKLDALSQIVSQVTSVSIRKMVPRTSFNAFIS